MIRDGAFCGGGPELNEITSGGSATATECVQVSIPGLPQFIGVARQAVDAVGEQLRLSADDRMAVRLAVGEACNNAVFHSRPRSVPAAEAKEAEETLGQGIGRVVVACRISPEALEIDVANDGQAAFRPREEPGRMPDALSESGRGMALMEMLMDSVEYLADKGCTVVRLRKLRRADAAPTPAPA